jgi:hypothetical protein
MLDADNQQLIADYRACFGSPAGQRVLSDLMKDCRFRAPIANQIEEGKRQAFLRIISMTLLTDEQLLLLYRGNRINTTGADE